MNVLLSLSDEELDALEDYWAIQMGSGDDARSEMAMKRIEQLHRLRTNPLDYVLEAA